jgi:O-antigen/teichoic acid export membrane protein
VFQILAATVFLQAVGYVPLTSLQAMGRPDLAAKYYLAEIPFYVLLCLVLIPPLGIEGAAWALCLRMITNVGCFFWLAHRTLGAPVVSLAPIGKSLLLNGFALVCLVVVESLPGLVSQLAGVCTVGAAYVAAAWLFSLDMTEREAIRNLVFSRRAQRDI